MNDRKILARGGTTLLPALLLFAASACGEPRDQGDDDGIEEGDLPAGSTAIVTILNPVVNAGHEASTPSIVASARDGIAVDGEPGGEDVTDATGLAVVGAEPDATMVTFGDSSEAPTLALDVLAEGDVYDVAVAFDGENAAYFDLTPIRYPVGDLSAVVTIAPDTPISEIESELEADDVVVVLQPGTYVGDLTIRGHGALLFGEGFSESHVVIDGSIQALGEAVRLRGLTIEGNVHSAGNNFGMSFSIVRGAAEITGNGGAFLRNVFCDAVRVPTDNAALLDNYGLDPLQAPTAGACGSEGSDSSGDPGY